MRTSEHGMPGGTPEEPRRTCHPWLPARLRRILLVICALFIPAVVAAQTPAAPSMPPAAPPPQMEVVTFEQAVSRALANNPTVAQAATAVLRAEGLLQQARSATLPTAAASVSTATIDASRGFSGVVVQPKTQSTILLDISMPVLAASRWAAAAQARDQIEVADLSAADVRKQVGVAAAQAYLGIINQRRQLEVNQRAREAALAHLDYARRRLAEGAGTRLNELRAAQEVASDDARLENARLAVRRAQEALGVLMAAAGPVDAAGEPTFDLTGVLPVPGAPDAAEGLIDNRSDIRLSLATSRAFERVWHDSRRDYFPTAVASFDPQALTPTGAFTASRSWRFTLNVSVPVFDAGQRRGLARFREAAATSSRLSLENLRLEAESDIRLAGEAVQSGERALASLRLAADQAEEVLSITNVAFEAGATTNLEVIDAQRSARDAETAAALAEDALRRARLDLLTAVGRFP